MKKHFQTFFSILILILCITSTEKLQAKKYSFGRSKSYTTKAPYSGFGKVSKSTGRIKTKSVRGYFKPSNGYKFVNPYSKSRSSKLFQ